MLSFQLFFFYFFIFLTNQCISFLSLLVNVVHLAKTDSEQVQQKESQRDKNTTKDDIARLLHLFKEPMAQRHWTNLYGILTRNQLDARKSSGEQSEAARPLSYLAEMFNDYQGFNPQNVMVQYVSAGPNERPIKKQPYQPSSSDWAALANHCHDIEPTNLARKHIFRGEDWIKETWNDCRKYLHQTFIQYNRSGQHDSEMDEWCSKKELERWIRATTYKSPGKFFVSYTFIPLALTNYFFSILGANSVIRFPSAMVYSIAVLDQSDFEGIGRQMPSGTGVDASLAADSSTTARKRKKRGKYNKSPNTTTNNNNNYNNNNNIASVIETIGNSESRLAALRILIEFGTAEEKTQALAEVRSLAYRNPVTTTTVSEVASNTAADGEATSEEVAAGANNEASCTGSEDEDSDGSL
jgi:hypothetical protein